MTYPIQPATQLYQGSVEYLNQLRDITLQNFPNTQSLVDHPEILDQLLNYQRIQDLCYSYLIDETARITGHHLKEHSEDFVFKFLIVIDPGSLVDFFDQENIINDFILANELNQPQSYDHDSKYQTQYQNLIDQVNQTIIAKS